MYEHYLDREIDRVTEQLAALSCSADERAEALI
jgi:hypothetical protein